MEERPPYRVRVSYTKKRAAEAEAFLAKASLGGACCEEEGNEHLALTARVYAYDSGGMAQTAMRRMSGVPGLVSLSLIPRSKCSNKNCPNKVNE